MSDYPCMVCGGDLGYEPQMCCSGRECGCMGMPVDPPICSDECYARWTRQREMETIIGNYSWIDVKSFDENDYSYINPNVDWKDAYKDLITHHKKETEFLINKCRELAKIILDGDKNSNTSEGIQVGIEPDDIE